MKSSIIENIETITERTIILLDGRKITFSPFSTFSITNHDQQKIKLRFGIFSKKSKIHHALSHVISDLLSTHSIRYVSTILHAFNEWLNLKDGISTDRLEFSSIESLHSINPSYPAFIIPILRRLTKQYSNLIDDEFKDFLENTIKWEERSPAYFKLIVNDPEKGAFTIQELENLHSELNLAFSKKN